MLGLTVQNFVSAATGMAVLVALIRGLARREAETIGNFWVDLTRTHPLHPAAALRRARPGADVRRAWCRRSSPYRTVELVQPLASGGSTVTRAGDRRGTRRPRRSPSSSSAPTAAASSTSTRRTRSRTRRRSRTSSRCWRILLIPAALCHTFGAHGARPRQGWAVLAAMTIIFVPLLAVDATLRAAAATRCSPPLGVAAGQRRRSQAATWRARRSASASPTPPWAVATTAASNGSVNSMHDRYTPLGGLVPMWLMQLGEVVFGGVGSGLYGMLDVRDRRASSWPG